MLEKLKSQRWLMWLLVAVALVLAVGAGAFNPWPGLLPGLAGGVEESRVVVIERRETKRSEKSRGATERQLSSGRRVTETFDGGTRVTEDWLSDLTRDTHFAELNLDERIDNRREETRKPALDRYRVGVMGGVLWPVGAPAVIPGGVVHGSIRLGDSPVWIDGALEAGGNATGIVVGAKGGLSLTFK